ncbi:hypothetical protein V6N11_049900 [Hibiscus sabdariffa]|uniref:Uncharacterized protein n=1 Tax=Hibiscus sabdariffa TaxID=183260 RepID=A0ABR2T8C6_9ROSI
MIHRTPWSPKKSIHPPIQWELTLGHQIWWHLKIQPPQLEVIVTDHEVAAIQVAQEALHRLLGLSNPSKLARPLENARGPS